jgi:hypothetical protein
MKIIVFDWHLNGFSPYTLLFFMFMCGLVEIGKNGSHLID